MKVLLVNGSPHQIGCTYTALHEVEKTLNECGIETEMYWIGNQPLAGCIDCGKCRNLHHCVFDDGVNAFRDKAKVFDGFIFGTPVYYASMNGHMKSFMDRLFFSDLWGGNNTFSHKPTAAVISARRAGTTNTFDELNKYFAHNQMPIVTSTYWNLIFGMTPEEVLSDKEGMHTMQMLGKNMAWILKSIEAGKKSGIELPKETF